MFAGTDCDYFICGRVSPLRLGGWFIHWILVLANNILNGVACFPSQPEGVLAVERLHSTTTGTLTGAHDIITFYHGLVQGYSKVTPDYAGLEFTQSRESSGSSGAPTSQLIAITDVPAADGTVTLGTGEFTEVWTWKATRSKAYEITLGGDAAACITNAVSAINTDTVQNIVVDDSSGVRIRTAVYPGGTVENRLQDFTGNAESSTNLTIGAVTAGSGNPAGAPSWSRILMDENEVRFKVAGLTSTSSMTFRCTAWRLHSMDRSSLDGTAKATGTDGVVTAGAKTLTSSGATFQTAGVQRGDILAVIEADSSNWANIKNNGAYVVFSVDSETQITLVEEFTTSQAGLDYSVGFGVALNGTETGITQLNVGGLSGGSTHSAAAACTDAEFAGTAVEVSEMDFSDPVTMSGKLTLSDEMIMADSNVAHGVTGVAITSAYGDFGPIHSTRGGLYINGLSDQESADARSLVLRGISNDTHTDTVPLVEIIGAKRSGASIQALAAAETVLQVANHTSVLTTVLGNGSLGVGTTTPNCMLHVAGAFAASGPSEAAVTFGASDTTPSVSTGNLFFTGTSTLTITAFDDGVIGQVITVISKGAITYAYSAYLLCGSTNIVTADYDLTRWICIGATAWQLIAFTDSGEDLSGGH